MSDHAIPRWWADRRLSTKGIVVVAVPLLIFLGSVALLYRASEAEASAQEDVRVTIAIQTDMHAVHALLADAASGVRGYLLTGQPQFLEPYRAAEVALPPVIRRLRSLIRDAEASRRLDRVEVLTATKRRGLAALLAQRGGGVAMLGRPEVLAALESNKAVLDELRDEIERIQARERVLLAERQARADAVRRRALLLMGMVTLAGVGGSVFAVFLFSSGIVRRVHRLRESAARLGRGEPLPPLPPARDELGELAERMAEAGALLRAREQALREGEERLRLVVEGVRDYGIFALDPDGNVASWNTGAERIKGWRADEILGRHFSIFYPEEERGTRPGHNLEAARRHGRAEDEGWRVRKDGARFWANVVITPLHDDAGVLRGFSKVTRDITERRQTEEAVQAARREAEAASAAKSAFLSRTSHELRTPLNAILGFAQLLELDARDPAPTEQEAVAQILQAGRHLLALIDEVLDIARIESGQFAVALEATPVADVVAEAIALTRPLAAEGGVMVTATVADDLRARADRRRLLQALLNLLSNAIKFNHAGGRVDVRAAVEGNGSGADAVVIEVADDGIGIEPDLVQRLFEPFQRLGRGAETRDGTGLGLTLSRSLMRAMGGDITYRRRDDAPSGSVFRLTVPRDDAVPARRHAESPAETATAMSLAVGPTILLIEDNLANVRLIERLVARAAPGAALLSAMQATLGVQLARQHAPALVLVDLHLPDRPGTWVLDQLAALPSRPAVFVLTADVPAAAVGTLKGRADRVFTKPVDVAALVRAMHEQLAARVA